MRMRRKKNLPERMARCGEYWITQPEELRNNWCGKMPQAKALFIELGCGKGGFTTKTAAAHPDVLFVAIERVPEAMVIAMERAQAEGLKNVLFVSGDAALLHTYFAPGEVDGIYINFCDPWPPARAAKRRLTHPAFLARYAEVLRQGGEIWLKTDNRDLFEWSLHQFSHAGFRLCDVTRDLHADGITGIMTDYEEKFHAQGIKINRCAAVWEPPNE